MFFFHPYPKGDPMNLVPKSYVKPNSPMPTILVVDDNPHDLDILLLNLKNFGFSVITVQDGEEALTQIRDHRPDLILMDLILPRIDGLETCRRLKADETLRDIPVIFMTTQSETDIKVKGFQAGGVDYVTKPFQIEEVLGRIQTHLALDSIRKRLQEQDLRLQQEEEALRRSEEKYRDLVENINDVLFSLDTQGCFTYISPAITRLTFYSPDEVIGTPFARFVHPEDLLELEKQFVKTLRGVLESYEFRIIIKDGSVRHVRSSSRPLWDKDFLAGLTGVMIDITQTKDAEAALRESEMSLRALMAVIPDPLVVYDTQGLITYVNHAFVKTYGWSPEDLLGQTIDFVPPDELERTRDAWERTMRQERVLLETKRFTKTGELLDIELTSAILHDQEGRHQFSIIIHRDVTERKRAEEELKKYREHLEDLVQERTGKLHQVNRMLKILSECNQAVVRATEEMELLQAICRILVELGGYPLVWVGFLEPDEARTIRPVARVGKEEGGLESLATEWAGAGLGQGMIRKAIETGKPCLADDLQPVSPFTFGKGESIRSGLSSSIGLPLWDENQVFGVLTIYASGSAAFPAPEVDLLEELANDLAFGIISLRARTERKQAEEALRKSESLYRLLAENSTDVIWTTDMNLKYTYISPSVKRLSGFSAEEAIQHSIEEDLTPLSLTVAMKAFQEEMELESREQKDLFRSRALELEQFCKDGRTLWTEVKMTFLRDEAGRPMGILGITRDISERKRSEKERARLERDLRQSQKMEAVGTLAGGVAHDFNNILMAIIGYTEIALFDIPEGSPVRQSLEQVLKAGDRARELVGQILAFSRRGEPERKPIQVTLIVREALKLLRSSLPSLIEIHHNLALPPGEDVILGDPTQIHQVLMNLGTNAAHSMRHQGGLLNLGLSRVKADAYLASSHPDLRPGNYLRLTVTDTGHGMEAAVIERIFDPYFTTKGVGEGTGLGLAVVQGIVKSHGGAITVYSEPGKGTSFQVFLPSIVHEMASEMETKEELPCGKERILFVDDEPMLVELGKKRLQSLGYLVTAVTNSLEALETFRMGPETFDLVITDMTMPGLTGSLLAQQLLAIRPGLPIILCTGFSHLINEQQAREMGIREFVMKPYPIADLARTIRKVLEEPVPSIPSFDAE